MSGNKRTIGIMAVIIALGIGLLTFTSTRKIVLRALAAPRVEPSQNRRPADRAGQYVRAGQLDPKLAWHLKVLGDRLERPGKERMTFSGTVSRPGAQPEYFVAVSEFPDRLQLRIQTDARVRVITFEDGLIVPSGQPLTAAERALVETLVYDSEEHFFAAQMEGQATRFLGGRFRLTDGPVENYSGPTYDIYQLSEVRKNSTDAPQQVRHYYFNSNSLLLERVHYQLQRVGVNVKVETLIQDWQKEQGQRSARRLERIENGQSVFVVTLSAVSHVTRADDGTFGSEAR